VIGTTGLDLLTGEHIVFEAKATVLASGGFGQLWAPETTTPLEAGGELLGIALRAGVEVIDMEFVQFLPMQIDRALKHLNPTIANFPGWREEIRRYAKMRNADGEDILGRYDTRGLYTTRDVRANAIYTELRAGRRVFLDLTEVPSQIIEQEFGKQFPGSYLPKLEEVGFSLLRDPMEIAIGAHYCMGGVRINTKAETAVTGLYAAGEVTGGVDGANRLGGNALTEIMAIGHIAGESAAQYAATAGDAKADSGQLELEMKKVLQVVERSNGTELVSPLAAKRELQQALWKNVCVRRNEDGLKETLQTIAELREKRLPRLGLSSSTRVFNLEWVQAIQLPAQLDVAEAVVRAALARTESRGAHRRDDYVEQDDGNWLKNIVLEQVNGEFEIQAFPSVITKLPVSEAVSWKP
jgi:succinate dehydrogenase/fumarate reductase flavoprotein subunit